ncbi:MAG: prolyl oligopeptidase family serine peptidase [Acidobacteriota bacterium]|nr:prolyl oligopeptidase family serine peptidase [Acidobacteriota bacterium]
MFELYKGKKVCLWLWLFAILILLIYVPGESSNNTAQKPLTHDDYDSWKTITSPEISKDGNWVLYIETPQDGDAFLVVKNLKKDFEYRHIIGYSGEGTDSEKEAKPQFSNGTTYVAFLISPSQEEVKKAKKDKNKQKDKKIKRNLGLMSLADGQVSIAKEVKSFAFPEESDGWVAYLKEEPEKEEKKETTQKKEEEEKKGKEPEKKKKYGTTLILRSLNNEKETAFESVTDYCFTKYGKYLLYIVSSKEKPDTDGVYSYALNKRTCEPLLTGKGNYKQWAIDEDGTKLAFLSDRDDQESKTPLFRLYGWEAGSPEATLWVSHDRTPGFPEGMAVSDKSKISFHADGQLVMFGIKEIPEDTDDKDEEEGEEEAKFDLWHWNDPYPQPQQKKIAKDVRNNTWETIYNLKTKKLVKLADETIPDVKLSKNGKSAYAQTILPYSKLVSYDGSYYDVYVINPQNGKKTLVKEKLYGGARLSPNGKYVYWFEDGNWHLYDIKSKKITNITKTLDVSFKRHGWDIPNPPQSYGIAGWTTNDASILIYDRYDIWEIPPDGTHARMVTEGFGRQNKLSFRYVKLDPKEETIDPKKPLLLKVRNEETMAEGFYRDRVQGKRIPEKLILEDRMFLSLKKAKDTEMLMFERSAFDEYPDLWVSNINMKSQSKITNLGDQMNPFIWGKAELRSFFSADGKSLKGILITPKNFEAGKKYPLLVYIYETLHTMFHRFRHPSPGTSINPSYYVSNGYVIWMPDIEYDTGYPGSDALKCVLPGIQMLVKEGFIDPQAIGIQGHSWGGYQIAYMITQTNIFAAAEAGAPVSNMVSAYGGIRWGSGMVRQFQYERTQSRLGASLWEVPMRYIENSPVFWADKVQTPLLMIHNDKDGAVPWYQGIEYIMALRRLEKEAYMFNYNGEEHGLRKRVNQKDWTRRMSEFFDHHLKGTPAAQWMVKGIQAWEKKEEKPE